MLVEWISDQLKLRGITQRELATAVGLTETQMSLALKGHRKLSADEADKIRRFFGYVLPHDLSDPQNVRIVDLLSRLDDAQKLSVILYLEALSGVGPKTP